MCFHWCSACGMLQTGMGKEKQQKAFFSFFNSILPVRRSSVGVYSFISSVRLRPVPALLLLTLLLSGRTGPQRLSRSFTPPSLPRLLLPSLPPPFSLSLSHTGFVGKQSQLDASLLFSPLWHWHYSFCVSNSFCNLFFCPSDFQSFIQIIQLFFFCFSPIYLAASLFLFMMQHGSADWAACSVSACAVHVNACKHTHIVCVSMSGTCEVLQDSRKFKGGEKKRGEEEKRRQYTEMGRKKKRKGATSSSRAKMREMIAGRGRGLKME